MRARRDHRPVGGNPARLLGPHRCLAHRPTSIVYARGRIAGAHPCHARDPATAIANHTCFSVDGHTSTIREGRRARIAIPGHCFPALSAPARGPDQASFPRQLPGPCCRTRAYGKSSLTQTERSRAEGWTIRLLALRFDRDATTGKEFAEGRHRNGCVFLRAHIVA
jgi:hypothetical protein